MPVVSSISNASCRSSGQIVGHFYPLAMSGGTITDQTISGKKYRLHTFTTVGSNTLTMTSHVGTSNTGDILIVGGGGGSGGAKSTSYGSGGGGGGRVMEGLDVPLSSASITVGAGGLAGSASVMTFVGGNSRYIGDTFDWEANGGGGGASALANGVSGGSGGGSGSCLSTVRFGGSAVAGTVLGSHAPSQYGNAGGNGIANSGTGAAGGGGAQGAGGNTVGANRGGNGGNGYLSSITGLRYGGGGGGAGSLFAGAAGSGGGGAPGFNGTNGLGGGAGGTRSTVGYVGGSGVVVVRYALEW